MTRKSLTITDILTGKNSSGHVGHLIDLPDNQMKVVKPSLRKESISSNNSRIFHSSLLPIHLDDAFYSADKDMETQKRCWVLPKVTQR